MQEEYVEVRSSHVDDRGDEIDFTVRFAKPMSGIEIVRQWNNPESALRKIISPKLDEKGWMLSGVRLRAPVVVDWKPGVHPGEWIFSYKWTGPDDSGE